MGRAPCCEKVGLNKGRWTEEEDDILRRYIETHGEGAWRSLPKNAGLLRCGKSCRLRWINYLKDGLKRGNITPQEEEIIVKMHASMGKKWSLIAGHLPGRTDNEIKNYWNSHLSRKLHSFKGPDGNTISILSNVGLPPKRRQGRISRSNMKKNINMQKDTVTRQPSYHQSNDQHIVQFTPSTQMHDKETITCPVQDYYVLDLPGDKINTPHQDMLGEEFLHGESLHNSNCEGEKESGISGMQCFDEFMDYINNDGVMVTNDIENTIASRECNPSYYSIGESIGEFNSCCSSITSFLKDTSNVDWNWEDVVQGLDLELSRDQETTSSRFLAINEEFEDMETVISDWLLS